MRSQVTVIWSPGATYLLDLEEVQPMPHDLARSWLDEQFGFFGCEPIRPTGKVLTADKILCVAQAAGEERFRDPAHRPWAMAFARAASAALGKPVVAVDVGAQALAY
ncbi:MAG: hypothetical protein ACK40L_06940 [Hydrogenophaga sp.]|jgi:hypothetical protein|nr:hypothetical protein [Hydrogenophaga sp.]